MRERLGGSDVGTDSMWLDLTLTLSCAGVGLACGWIVRAVNTAAVRDQRRVGGSPSAGEPHSASDFSRDQILEVAERLRCYASRMAADVDAHQTRVQAVNDWLVRTDASALAESVFEAVNQLIDANEEMHQQLQSAHDRIQDQAMQIETAEKRAKIDDLTRVFNRLAFEECLAQRAKLGPPEAGTLVLLDIDRFKQLNEVYGHRAGDEVLRVVGGVINTRLGGRGLVARFGGEEFAAILFGTSVRPSMDVVESVRAALGQREIRFEGHRLRLTMSAGVAELLPRESLDSWLQRADDALRRCKQEGGDCGHWMDGRRAVRIGSVGAEDGRAEVRSAPNRRVAVAAVAAASQPVAASRRGGHTATPTAADVPEVDVGSAADARTGEAPAMLRASFEDVLARTHAIGKSMFVLAVRLSGRPTEAELRSLCQIVRASVRNLDRVVRRDDSTLIVCMPSADAMVATGLGHQICEAVASLGLADRTDREGVHPVSVGILQALPGDDFDELAGRVCEAAVHGASASGEPIRVCDPGHKLVAESSSETFPNSP